MILVEVSIGDPREWEFIKTIGSPLIVWIERHDGKKCVSLISRARRSV